MKLIDISREAFTAPNYDDDPPPRYKWFRKTDKGDSYNLSVFCMTPHTGTHIDAPLHYLDYGESVDKCGLESFCGPCTVVTISGALTGEDMDRLLPHCQKRLLIHGNGDASLELSGARVLTERGICLVGIDSVSISFPEQEDEVHRELLSNGTFILENLCLDNVPDGKYILYAFPLKLGGIEASPVRAVLMEI